MRTFGVRLGKHGVGKRREGDGKVPIGRYPLGAPRHSDKYGLFIPIQYPTPAQRKAGYSGGSVGVHGPHRRVRWLGRLTNLFDTTDGCVGIATDDDMKAIADWVLSFNLSPFWLMMALIWPLWLNGMAVLVSWVSVRS